MCNSNMSQVEELKSIRQFDSLQSLLSTYQDANVVLISCKDSKSCRNPPTKLGKSTITQQDYGNRDILVLASTERPIGKGKAFVNCVVIWKPFPELDLVDLKDSVINFCQRADKDRNRTFYRSCTYCDKNKNCTCQGEDESIAGRSYSFGCRARYGRCVYFQGKESPKKFRLPAGNEEMEMQFASKMCSIADNMAHCCKRFLGTDFKNVVPNNACAFKSTFLAGVTCNLDYTAHYHFDTSNLSYTPTCVLSVAAEDNEQVLVIPDFVNIRTGQEICLDLPSGSVYFLEAKHVKHGTSVQPFPNRKSPKRISIVFFRHAKLNLDDHGRPLAPPLEEIGLESDDELSPDGVGSDATAGLVAEQHKSTEIVVNDARLPVVTEQHNVEKVKMVRKAGKICPAKRITRSTVQYLNKIDKKRKHSNKSGKLRAEREAAEDQVEKRTRNPLCVKGPKNETIRQRLRVRLRPVKEDKEKYEDPAEVEGESDQEAEETGCKEDKEKDQDLAEIETESDQEAEETGTNEDKEKDEDSAEVEDESDQEAEETGSKEDKETDEDPAEVETESDQEAEERGSTTEEVVSEGETIIKPKVKRKVKCKICQKEYKSQKCLQKHYNTIHVAFRCTLCNKGFAERRPLVRHNKKVHLCKTMHKCSDHPLGDSKCQKVFLLKRSLMSHLSEHGRVSSMKCKYCSSTLPRNNFGTKCALLKHIRDFHAGDELQKADKRKIRAKDLKKANLSCKYCEKTFRTKTQKNEHVEGCKKNPSRNRIPCNLCNRVFSLQKYLYKHLREKHREVTYSNRV